MFEQFFAKLFSLISLENNIVTTILGELNDVFDEFNDKLSEKLNQDI